MLPITATPSEIPRSFAVVASPDAPPAFSGGTDPTTRSVVSAMAGATPG